MAAKVGPGLAAAPGRTSERVIGAADRSSRTCWAVFGWTVLTVRGLPLDLRGASHSARAHAEGAEGRGGFSVHE
jgi:hypothetical protein